MARPTKLTDAVLSRVCEALETGAPLKAACAAAGIGERTLLEWRRRHERVRDAVDEAIARSEAALVRRIADDPSWQSKAWLLERRFPERWGRHRLEIAHSGGQTIRVVISGGDPDPSDDQVAEIARRAGVDLEEIAPVHGAGLRAPVGEDDPPGPPDGGQSP